MNLLHLEYFYLVAREGGFTQAALKARISQPAISKQVKLLEDYLGKPLLKRSTRSISLTLEGSKVFEIASRIFKDAQNIKNSIMSESDTLGGPYCIGMSDNLGIHLFPKVIGEFKRRNSAIDLKVFIGNSKDIKAEMQINQCDAGLFFTPLRPGENFIAEKLCDVEFVAVTAPISYISKIQKKIRIKKGTTLSQLRALNVKRLESRTHDYFNQTMPEHFHSTKLGIDDKPEIEINNNEVKKKLCLLGYGYTLLPIHVVQNEIKSGELIRIKTAKKMWSEIFWVTHKDSRPNPISIAFKKSILNNIKISFN